MGKSSCAKNERSRSAEKMSRTKDGQRRSGLKSPSYSFFAGPSPPRAREQSNVQNPSRFSSWVIAPSAAADPSAGYFRIEGLRPAAAWLSRARRRFTSVPRADASLREVRAGTLVSFLRKLGSRGIIAGQKGWVALL